MNGTCEVGMSQAQPYRCEEQQKEGSFLGKKVRESREISPPHLPQPGGLLWQPLGQAFFSTGHARQARTLCRYQCRHAAGASPELVCNC